MKPGDLFPFPDESFDLIVSTSCFEHDPCFWMTFREMARVIKKGGYIYMNAPSNGPYHGYPGDNWRFYSDAGQALAYWSGKTIDGKSYPVKVEETFHILPGNDIWIDFICVWKRVEEKEEYIKLSDEFRMKIGPLRKSLTEAQYSTQSVIYQY
jgi:SAM-dependent methyltransferase